MMANATATAESGTGPDTQGRSMGRFALNLFERFALVLLLAAFVLVFALWKPDQFPTSANIQALLQSQAVNAVVALAVIVPLMTGRFDLSVGSTLTLTSLISAGFMSRHGVALFPAMGIGLGLGLVIGAINGFFVAYMGVSSLVVTLASATAMGGIITLYSSGEIISSGISHQLTKLGTEKIFGLPTLFILMLAIAVVVWYLLVLTPFGRRLTAIGSNESSALLVGIRVKRVIFLSFVASGFLGAVAGLLQIANQGSANPTSGGLEIMLPALSGAFLGATVFTPGRYNVPGTLVGLFVVAVLVNGLALVGANPAITPIVNGVAVMAAVTLSTYLRRRRSGEA